MPVRRLARKAGAVASRSISLARWARPQRFELALGHGSVDLGVVSALLRIPSVQMQDYEHAGLQRQVAFRVARRVLVPDAIPPDAMRRAGANPDKLFRYPGLKEDYYLADFQPDRAVLDELGIDADRVIVVMRPSPGDVRLPRCQPARGAGARSPRRRRGRHLRGDPPDRRPGGADPRPPGGEPHRP